MADKNRHQSQADLYERLADYGQWLDNAASDYLHELEFGNTAIEPRRPTMARRKVKALSAVAATFVFLIGSFVVNKFGGLSNSSSVALAWSASPTEATDEMSQKIVDACEKENPNAEQLKDAKTALDIRGSIAIRVWVTGDTVDMCIATVNQDLSIDVATMEHGLPLMDISVRSDVSGIQVLSVRYKSQKITVVIGRDDVLPANCRNLDVYTSKGTIRALRVSGLFAFWYPGDPAIIGRDPNSIKYSCAAESGASDKGVTVGEVAGPDSFANLCIETLTVLQSNGIIDPRGNVLDLSQWDMGVYVEFHNRLQPLVEALPAGLSDVYRAWSELNEGGILAQESAGKLKLENRSVFEAQVTSSISKFLKICEGSRTPPWERGVPPTSTTVPIHELVTSTETTIGHVGANP